MFADAGTLWHGAWELSAFWAWVFTIALTLIMVGGVLYEELAPAGLFMCVLLVFAHLIGAVDLGSVLSNPLILLVWLAPYLVLGLVFCIYRYKFWLRSRVQRDIEYGYLKTNTHEQIAESYKPSKQIDRLTIWIVWWPICLIRLMLGDWLQAFIRYIVNDLLGKFFQSIWKGEVERFKQQQKGL